MRFPSLAFVIFLLALISCEPGIRYQEYRILRTLPHDPEAYTQGLVYDNGILFESTGRYGESSIRKSRLETGEILEIRRLEEEYFGEGLALVGRELYQLTWQEGLVFVYDADSLTLRRTYEYEGEGWGLCYDGKSLYMSNGTDRLFRRNPETFEIVEELRVLQGGFSVSRLNELECVGDDIFANVYQSARILRIDKASGRVISELDGFPLSAAAKRAPDPGAVLNGIAHDPASGTLFVTGKLWESLFEIELVGG